MQDKLDNKILKEDIKEERDSCEGVKPWVQKIQDGNAIYFRISGLENCWFGIKQTDEVYKGKKVYEYIGIKHF